MTTPDASAAQAEHPHHHRNRLIYTEEVADLIRRSPAAVRYMIHKGTAPKSALIGGRRMFRESEVIAWIDQQFQASA